MGMEVPCPKKPCGTNDLWDQDGQYHRGNTAAKSSHTLRYETIERKTELWGCWVFFNEALSLCTFQPKLAASLR